jgi:hypothetical protein
MRRDREACFGRAIHSFFECVKQCPPPTCEQACEAKARQHQMQCLDDGGTVDGCNREAREILARCNEEACTDPNPPTCKEECESHAQEVYDRCIEGGTGGTGGIAPTPKTGAGGRDGAGGQDGAGGSGGDGDSDSHGGSDSDSHGDSDSGKDCDPDGLTPKKGGHCK